MTNSLIISKSNNVRMSPRKVRLVTDVIKGKNAVEISQKLVSMNKAAAKAVLKTLNSALANAKNNFGIDESTLIIKESRVDEGIKYKRGKPVSKGRYHRIIKRSSHIIIGLYKPEI
jgi:large subunit ribosomal protein L22